MAQDSFYFGTYFDCLLTSMAVRGTADAGTGTATAYLYSAADRTLQASPLATVTMSWATDIVLDGATVSGYRGAIDKALFATQTESTQGTRSTMGWLKVVYALSGSDRQFNTDAFFCYGGRS